MTFTEKLNSLMNLTSMSNAELARSLGVDRSSVSRFRTGARGMPKPPVLRQLAEAFAIHCGEDYKLSALYDLTGDPRLHQQMTGVLLSEILGSWLQSRQEAPKMQVGQLLRTIEVYSPAPDEAPPADAEHSIPPGFSGFLAYPGNDGKRRATLDFLSYVGALPEPCAVKLFSDESTGWLVEDPSFSRELTRLLRQLAARGFQILRIQPPMSELEYSLRSVERWLPAYVTGCVTQYFYPYARDELHRRTAFVVPGRIAVSSFSIAGQREAPMSFLTTDADLVDAFDQEFDIALARCRRTMIVHGMDRPQELFDCLEALVSREASGIYKSGGLSSATLPRTLIDRIASDGGPLASQLSEAFIRRAAARDSALKRNTVTDIMCLRPVADVLGGRVPVMGTGLLPNGPCFYRPAEYIQHLERILFCLETYPNYQAVVMDDPIWDGIILYAKADASTLLVKESDPAVILEITEQTMSDSFWDYLHRIATDQMRLGTRRGTKARIQEDLNRLRAAN